MSEDLIYLASPYSHPDKEVMEDRAIRASVAAGVLIHEGFNVFSPIAHGYFISLHCGQEISRSCWVELDCAILRECGALWVLTMDGWKESKGIATEIDNAVHYQIPISYLDPVSYELKTTTIKHVEKIKNEK